MREGRGYGVVAWRRRKRFGVGLGAHQDEHHEGSDEKKEERKEHAARERRTDQRQPRLVAADNLSPRARAPPHEIECEQKP